MSNIIIVTRSICVLQCAVCADYCVYNGRYYRQGEEWYDGCSLKCRCEDARNHYHQCTTRYVI